MKTIKKDQESEQEINTKTYLKNEKIKEENVEKQIPYVWRKKAKAKRISKKLSRGKKKSQYNNE